MTVVDFVPNNDDRRQAADRRRPANMVCPMPRCSYEWGLALLTIVVGFMIGVLSDQSTTVLASLQVPGIPAVAIKFFSDSGVDRCRCLSEFCFDHAGTRSATMGSRVMPASLAYSSRNASLRDARHRVLGSSVVGVSIRVFHLHGVERGKGGKTMM